MWWRLFQIFVYGDVVYAQTWEVLTHFNNEFLALLNTVNKTAVFLNAHDIYFVDLYSNIYCRRTLQKILKWH